jgi:hypothetical protein
LIASFYLNLQFFLILLVFYPKLDVVHPNQIQLLYFFILIRLAFTKAGKLLGTPSRTELLPSSFSFSQFCFTSSSLATTVSE